MRRRTGISLGLAALVLCALGLGWSRLPRPAEPEPEHYRVEYEVPTVEAALWFAARYPLYFKSGETELDTWLARLHPRDREFVLAMAQSLMWAWVEHELALFEGEDPVELALQASVVVRGKTISQLETYIGELGEAEGMNLWAFVGDPSFGAGVFGRLVRGASNCEGQNHFVAVLLDSAFDRGASWIPGLEARMVGVPGGHEIARITGPTLAQAIFVDAWANIPPFCVDPGHHRLAPLLSELGDAPPPVIPGLVGRTPHPVEAYVNSRGLPIPLVPARRAPTKPVDLEISAPELDRASLARIRDPWKIYLFARILHIYDDPRASELYAFILDHHCETIQKERAFVCTMTGLLAPRVESAGL